MNNDIVAFPMQFDDGSHQNGMTLRDYFAAAALTGLIANSYSDGVQKPLSHATNVEMADMAYGAADEMLKRRALDR